MQPFHESLKTLFNVAATASNADAGYGRINCRRRRENRNPVREEISRIIARPSIVKNSTAAVPER
ncbi:hypothetical protein [Desulfatitalea alkaliphila]|uniref:Uncharacterized protein n=1 Tax=Desulfatitalea alkaliphila TaxID=2929485 RepID=A0AA41R079_9BACT|nr:hypothetical protein [Desulfatitalea alkaliphila]MCJ8499759.1 hypothetical protein [Desulfatitalea alkaliphila]